ncbi:2OG-Fe dioxygenase family protein [Kibdelosporangium philippinense]|uniref:2OG-Fe dioxygenase family protein n=1 Tax=Kibdelosporangium philippinense TaxID=211113 RepID=A0ABS8ZKJ5_9PSEU|nr:2OG-Fe dioxygenase family protein [Kibdelosporangium philippinense]MCE7008309.1 2OG-Fe dioxygenase family protein [Kibdelosporangium philippinense]
MTETITPAWRSPADLNLAWKHMRTAGYFLGSDDTLGLRPGFRQRLHQNYFTEAVLRNYPDDSPADRERARDVLRYRWSSEDKVELSRHDAIGLGTGNGRKGPTEVARAELSADAEVTAWTAGILSCVPPEKRLEEGTFGVNLFRTRTQVVSGPHQDHEQFIVVYVVAKTGTGAETSLHTVDDEADVVVRTVLRPGEFVIFDDSRFKHSASPLIDPPDGKAMRDVLVCTVNYPGTYPIEASQLER